MKNLKKVLALVLVFASLLGLATMASATTSDDYSDAASITHVEAVDVMSTIGVFDGISGAFSGDSILTREQAAKIITYMVLGKDQADALVASVAPYTDVARDRWSAGSIAYCKNAGILAGVGNGRFEPNGRLTGVAFAKMCLVALGYDPDIEGLTGSNWAVNTSKLAIASAGITADLSQVSLADEMSREDACQMAFNTLKADLVDYDDRGMSVTVNNGNGNDIVITGNPSKAKPISYDTAKVGEKNSIGNIKDNEDTGYLGGVLQFAERYFPKLVLDDDATDSFGRPANTWTYKAEEIGTYRRNDWLVQSWTAKASKAEMYNAIGSSVYKKVDKDGSLLSAYANGHDTNSLVSTWFEKNSSKAAGADKQVPNGQTGNGVLTELYMNDEGKVWVSLINTYLVKATADYNSVRENVTIDPISISDKASDIAFLPTEISNDDFDVTGVKEGDYLLLTVSFKDETSNKNTKIESVTYATVQKGTVTEYTEEDNVVMDGTKYSYNKILSGEPVKTTFAIDSEATLVLDTYGYIMCVDDSVDSSRYVYINKFAAADGLSTNVIADAYFTDGTNEHITVSKVDKIKDADTILGKAPNSTAKSKGWYTFTGSTGGKYTLTQVPTTGTDKIRATAKTVSGEASKEIIKSGTVRFMSKIDSSSTLKGDDKTIFVIKTDDDVYAYTGISNVPDVKFTAAATTSNQATVYYVYKDEFAKYVFIDASASYFDVDEGSSVADYMYVLKKGTKTTYVSGSEYRTYTVVIDGKVEDRWIDTGATINENRLYYSVKENSNGYIKDAKEVGRDGNNNRRFMAAMGKTQSEANDYLLKASAYGTSLDTENVISRSGNTLTVGALKHAYSISGDTIDKSDLVTDSKSNINLVIGGKCDDLLKDDGADYEVYLNTSTNQVTGLLGDNKLGGRVYLVVTEDGGDVVDQLWIFVDKVY